MTETPLSVATFMAKMKTEPALVPPATLTTMALTLPESITFEEWQALGQRLGRVNRGYLFWIGDWLLGGEMRFGEQYAQVIPDTDEEAEATYGVTLKTLMNLRWVAKAIPAERRKEDEHVTWAHHAAVAACPPEEQTKWLDVAAEKKLTERELREARRQVEKGGNEPSTDPESERIRKLIGMITKLTAYERDRLIDAMRDAGWL